jgi:hypothetical protein
MVTVTMEDRVARSALTALKFVLNNGDNYHFDQQTISDVSKAIAALQCEVATVRLRQSA